MIDLTSQIAGDHVEGDELVAAGDDVAIVRGELHGKDGKLVAFKAVLERAPRRVHAVVGWHLAVQDKIFKAFGHQSVLLDPFRVALSQQIPDKAMKNFVALRSYLMLSLC